MKTCCGIFPTNDCSDCGHFKNWLNELQKYVSEQLNVSTSEVKINEDKALEYFNDGFTPSQCFRESW